jgi:hypothetical protein
MTGRRTAVMLCVLLAHALVIYELSDIADVFRRVPPEIGGLETWPITIDLAPDPDPDPDVEEPEEPDTIKSTPAPSPAPVVAAPAPAPAQTPGESSAPAFVDWPVERRISAKRVLEAEREAERIAKMFSGPDGTWASLTKRERSRLQKFRWKKGVDGLEYDEKGNAIYHISEGCVVVNLLFIGCALGKEKVHGDLFKEMRLYFDEQRLPPTTDGNGTEPEALRPAN